MKKNNKKLIALCVLAASILPLTSFGTTMSQAVQTALNNLPDLQIDVANQNANAQTIKQAQAGYLPTLNGNAGYGREHAVNAVAGVVGGSDSNTLNRGEFGLNLTENVFDGFNTVNEVKHTKAETAAAAYQVYGTANDMALNVIEQYLKVIVQQKVVALSQQNVRTHRSIAGTISERQNAGVAGTSELSQADTRISLAESNLITEQTNLDDARTEYQRYVGIAPTNLAMPSTPSYPAIPRTEQQAIQIALANHPVLLSADDDITASIAQHEASKFTNYPKVDLVLEADDNNNIDGIEGPQDNYLAMARASYNFFAGGANVAKQRETAFNTQQAIAIRNRTILQTEEAVRLAWTAMINEQKRIRTLSKYRVEAAQTFASYSEEFKLNKRTLLDLLDAQNEVYQSNVSYQEAISDEVFARYRLLNAMGTLNRYLNDAVPGANPQLMNAVPINQPLSAMPAGNYSKLHGGHSASTTTTTATTHSNYSSAASTSSPSYAKPAYGQAKSYQQQPVQVAANSAKVKSQAATAANQPAAAQTVVASAPMPTAKNPNMKAGNYAIQLMAATSRAEVKSFIAENNISGPTMVHQSNVNGQTWYELLYGNYKSSGAANAALANLPGGLQEFNPWVKQIPA